MEKKNCILYLVRTSEEDLENLNKSLSLVKENVLPNNPGVDILLFHEEDFTFMKSRVVQLPNMRFQLVNFPTPPADAPEIFPHPLPEQVAMGNLGFTMGYRHMCHFFAGGMFDYPILQDYKYYMRLDTDSYILSPIEYDIFDMMEKGGYKYGFFEPGIQLDHPDVVEGLWEFCWKETHDIPDRTMYYNNFEIGHIETFRTGLPYMFFKRIEAHGGIYTRRWGDACLRYLCVNLLMPKEWRVDIRGFIYQHGHVYDLR